MNSKIIQRHFFCELLNVTIVSTTILLCILLYGNLIKHDESLLQAVSISKYSFFRLCVLLIPYALSYALPFGFVLSLLFCYGKWSSTKQILALRSLGQGVLSWGKPCFLLSFIVSIFTLYVFLDLGPRNRAKFDREKSRIAWANINNLLEAQNSIQFDLGDTSSRANALANLSNLSDEEIETVSLTVGEVFHDTWSNVRITLLGKDRSILRILNSRSVNVQKSNDNSKLFLYLNHVDFESPVKDSEEFFVTFEKWDNPLIFDLGKKNNETNLKRISFGKLLQESFSNRPQSEIAKVMIQKNFALGCSSFFLCTALLPLSVQAGRKESMSNIAFGLLFSISYFGCLSIFEDIAYSRNWPFFLWIPNVFCFVVGLFLLLRFDYPTK
jgi:lipopolysaccharide export system permease protein